MALRQHLTFRLHWLAQHHPRLLAAATLSSRLATGLLCWAALAAARADHLSVAGVLIALAAWGLASGRTARRSLHTDALTGLPTRAAYTTILAAGRRRTGRGLRGSALTVGLVDADGLHQINHTFGHAGGDQYLTGLARRLRAALPRPSLLLRLGGDEFAILAPGVPDSALAAAITAALGGQSLIAGHQVALRASAGVASVHADPSWGLALADAALAGAKNGGGNQVAVYDAARDGVPDTDGTRPRIRRRDTRSAAIWQPPTADHTLMLPVSDNEARALLAGLRDYLDHRRAPTAASMPDLAAHTGPADGQPGAEAAELAVLAERLGLLLHAGSLTRPRPDSRGRGHSGA